MDKSYSFARVYPPLNISASLKMRTEDFIVEENISIEFSGEGEHCWVYIEKHEANTDWVAQQLAKFCKVKKMAVSYAGLKDRHAITSQWFSVQLPGKPTPDWSAFETFFSDVGSSERVRVLQSVRHDKKLQRGALKSNTFKITLRHLKDNSQSKKSEQGIPEQDISDSGISEEGWQKLKQRCDVIARQGVPNYFGGQRFGRHLNNLDQAEKVFSISRNGARNGPRNKLSRHKRGLYFSAARSWMFNCILSERIKQQVWDKRLPGDVFMLDGKSACFIDGQDDAEKVDIQTRLSDGEIHPTAILWGEGDLMVGAQAADLEMAVINQFAIFRDGLIAARLKARRRACRVIPAGMSCQQKQDEFVVSFTLPAGSYATMVLAEMFSQLQEVHNHEVDSRVDIDRVNTDKAGK